MLDIMKKWKDKSLVQRVVDFLIEETLSMLFRIRNKELFLRIGAKIEELLGKDHSSSQSIHFYAFFIIKSIVTGDFFSLISLYVQFFDISS